MYEVVLFDLDGTLTDPKVGITKSVQYALAKYGILEQNPDALIPFIGPPLIDSFQEFYGFSSDQARQAVEYYREYFSVTGLYENGVYPGIEELLQQLTSSGKKLIVATSKPTVFSIRVLQHFKLDQYFALVAGSNLDGTGTAKTEVIAGVMEGLPGISKNSIIMVGDRKFDIIGAKDNGIDSIGVLYGYGSREELQLAGADFFAREVFDLNQILGIVNHDRWQDS